MLKRVLVPSLVLLVACGSKDETPMLMDMAPIPPAPASDAGTPMSDPVPEPTLTPDAGTSMMPEPAPAEPAPPTTPACPAMDVQAERPESACGFGNLQGWYWDGGSCQALAGCGCIGADCASLYADRDTCVAQRTSCSTAPAPASCNPANAQGTGSCGDILGWIWNGSSCVPLGGCTCSGADCGTVVPDRATCDAAHASCSGTTTTPPPTTTCGMVGQACCTSGTACTTGARCNFFGMCEASPDTPPSGGSCGTNLGPCCTSGTACQSGMSCILGTCLPGSGSGTTGVGQSCRDGWGNNGRCIDTRTSSCTGRLSSGLCPGPSNVSCCLTGYGS